MEQRELERVKHYCHLLHLNRWDCNDIMDYIIKHSAYQKGECSQEDYRQSLNKIRALELEYVVATFEGYLEDEYQNYLKLHAKKNDLSDNEIWNEVYEITERNIHAQISEAKAMANDDMKNRGCFLTLILLCVLGFLLVVNI